MKVETGVIAAAGSGTRMLPVTIGYPKELLPIINKPAIQLIVEEFIDSGLKRIIIVTGPNSDALRRQYDLSSLPPRGVYEQLDQFIDKLSGVALIFETQRGPYGNGTPLVVARPHIPDGEGFVYAFGDDIIKSDTPFTRQLIEAHSRTGALAVGTQEVPWEDVVRYGIAQLKEGEEQGEIDDIVEKPKPGEARSNLAIFGRYLLSTDVIQILTEIPLGRSNELWLTDALREHLRRGGKIVAESIRDGRWFTIGDPLNYIKTVVEYALSDLELREALAPFIRERLDRSEKPTPDKTPA
ncbi:MAG TPA: sugar phosphate nucleotidyltransferase [Blastocatellia bacterium]|nr:sugar phosphate nucleotidyltransferase [Blastocatellia bacterium]